MSSEPKDWEKITPRHLRHAVEHIRKSFDTSAWRCSEVTRRLGFAALHPHSADLADLAEYVAALDNYHRIVGLAARRQFEHLLSFKTPPSAFRAYCDLYQLGLEANIRAQFDSTIKVALANLRDLNEHPVDWAKLQLEFLIKGHLHLVERWIKEVCDTQEIPEPESIAKEWEEIVFWTRWRAPRLIHMQPAGNMPYDPTTAWTREDEARTRQLLTARSHRFLEFLDIALEKMAGDAHVWVAQNPEYLARKQPPKSPANVESAEVVHEQNAPVRDPRPSALLSNYRSEVKRAILVQITRNPNATDLEVCRGLDADGAVELPTSWRVRPPDRLFVGAYANPATRRKVEIAISKIRADLRNKGLLGPR